MAWISGLQGYVLIDTGDGNFEEWKFSKWKYKVRTKIVPRNAWGPQGGFDENVGGFTGADLELSGPWDDAPPSTLTSGENYTWYLGLTDDPDVQEFTLDARLGEGEVTNDAEAAPDWRLSATSNGPFAANIPQAA